MTATSTGFRTFLIQKSQLAGDHGFAPISMPFFLMDFQVHLVDWAIRKGRAALFGDCGLGKTPMQLVWADNVVRKTNRPVLIVTPLAVSAQTLREAVKFDIDAKRSRDGKVSGKATIYITNYEQLTKFDPNDFAGMVCDESGILKNFDGKFKGEIVEFMRRMPYRLLCTATAAPNDYTELGNSSEALGELGYTDMLTRFFKNDQNTVKPMRYTGFGNPRGPGDNHTDKWRFKGHAEIPFYKWICTWARAVRKPSDLGFNDGAFTLPPLIEEQHMVDAKKLADGMLFSIPAVGLKEQRAERSRTVVERCEKVAELVQTGNPAIVWCHQNAEGDLLDRLIPDGKQVSGKDSDDAKEEKFLAFCDGSLRVLVIKPKIGAWGLNFQHCNHVTFFPSHSFEQYYQGVRRCWRFGQKHPVKVDIITTEGEQSVLENLQRKAAAADKMFASLIEHMNQSQAIDRNQNQIQETFPSWL